MITVSTEPPESIRRRIWTSRYQNPNLREGFEAGRLATIGITQGPYRYSVEGRGYRSRLYKKLAPEMGLPLDLQVGSPDDRRQYLARFLPKLAELDPEQVYVELCELADKLLPGSTEIVLLDFVDLQDPNDYSHRILVAAWLSIGLGIRVQEYPEER